MRPSAVAMIVGVLLAGCGGQRITSAAGTVVISPDSLHFGVVLVGSDASRSLVLRSESRSAASYALELPAGFSASNSTGSLAPGQTATIEVRFQPEAEKKYDAVSTIRLGSASASIDLVASGALPSVSIDSRLDFGDVLVGSPATRTLTIRSLAKVPLKLAISLDGRDAARFQAPESVFVPPGATASAVVTFLPIARDSSLAIAHLLACAKCTATDVQITGNGTILELDVMPPKVDFGVVAVGETAAQPVILTNGGDTPLVRLLADLQQGAGSAFTLGDAPSSLGIEEATKLWISFTPTLEGSFEGFARVQFGESSLRIPVSGQGAFHTLAATPSPVDFGRVPVGGRASVKVRLSRLAGDPVQISVATVKPTGPFTVDPGPLPAFIGPGTRDATITFAPRDASLATAELVLTDFDPAGPLRLKLTGQGIVAKPCSITVSNEIRFGAVSVGRGRTANVRVTNEGTDECLLWGFHFDPAQLGFFTTAADVESVAAGSSRDIGVAFRPTGPDLGTVYSRLLFEAAGAPQSVDLSAQGIALDVWVDPSAAELAAPAGTAALSAITLHDNGPGPVRILQSRFLAGASAGFSWFALPLSMVEIHEGTGADAVVRYDPGTLPSTDTLAFDLEGIREPVLVELSGTPGPACGARCRAVAACPAQLTGFAGVPLQIDAGAISAGAKPSSCGFATTKAPDGAQLSLTAVGCTATLTADLPGDYGVSLTSSDGTTCSTPIKIAPQSGIWVDVTWSPLDDVELHLLHPRAGDPLEAASWWSLPWACDRDDPSPDWDLPGHGDDPVFDGDDELGSGPERIRVPSPSTDHPYTIGVHWFRSSHGNASLDVTTRVFCDGIPVATVHTPLRNLHEGAVVGSVSYSAAGACTLQPDGTVVTVDPP